MKLNINSVLDKHQKKTKKEFTLTGKAVSIIGPRVIVDVGGQRYEAINTRSLISVGDECSISRGTNNRQWRVSEVFNDPLRGGSMARQDMFGNGELTSLAVTANYPDYTFSAADVGTWKELPTPLYITIKRPRIMATIGLEVRNITVSGYFIYAFRFSVDDDTYFSIQTGSYTSISTGGSHTITNNITLPIVDLPPGLHEVTPQIISAMSMSGNQITVGVKYFYLQEI